MTWLDRLIQRWRMDMALRHVPAGARLLDIGTHDGLMFERSGTTGVGIDPELVQPASPRSDVWLIRGSFPLDLPPLQDGSFDVATALAVVEHVEEEELAAWAVALSRLLVPGGLLVITVPAPTVDKILHVLMAMRLIAGMEAHQHHGFVPKDLESVFVAPQWRQRKHRRFQLGLNHLYVFERLAPL